MCQTFLQLLKHRLFSPHHHHHHAAILDDVDSDDDDSVDDDNDDDDDDEYLTRDEFNLHKIIVTVTSAGKVGSVSTCFVCVIRFRVRTSVNVVASKTHVYYVVMYKSSKF